MAGIAQGIGNERKLRAEIEREQPGSLVNTSRSMYNLQPLIGKSELPSGEGELPIGENEATLAEFYLDVEECSKHTSKLQRNLKDWKGILESAKARGGATPKVLQGLRSSAAVQIEKEDEEAKRLGRMKKNALLLEKHLVRLSRLCMSQEEIIHNLRKSERQHYLGGRKDDDHGQFLLEDSSYLHQRLQDLSDALQAQTEEAKQMKAKAARELEAKYTLEQRMDLLVRQLRDKNDKLASLEAQLEDGKRYAESEMSQLRADLTRLESRGLVRMEKRMADEEEERDLAIISLQGRMRDAFQDKKRLERKLRLEDEPSVRSSLQLRITEIDGDRARLRERIEAEEEEREGEECLVIHRKHLFQLAKNLMKRVMRRILREHFVEWQDLCLGYKRMQVDPATTLDLETLSTPGLEITARGLQLTDYRFVTMKFFAKWTQHCILTRETRAKIRKIESVVSKNNARVTLRAWALHCQSLRHSQVRAGQISAYFESRTQRLAFDKWKTTTKKIKRLLYPALVESEEVADRSSKIRLTRWAFRLFADATKKSIYLATVDRRMDRKRTFSCFKNWRLCVLKAAATTRKVDKFRSAKLARCLKLWLRFAKSRARRNVGLGRLEARVSRRILRDHLIEWNEAMRRRMYHLWVLEQWGERQRKRRMAWGLEKFRLTVARKLRGSKFAMMLRQLNVQNLRAKAFYKWAATAAANVLTFAIQKVHDHLNTVDIGILSMAVQYDENDPRMQVRSIDRSRFRFVTILFLTLSFCDGTFPKPQDIFVIAKKIDTNLEAVKAALQDAHAVFREGRRTRSIVGEYSSAISGMAEPGPPVPTGLMNADELGLTPGAQAILLKRKVRPPPTPSHSLSLSLSLRLVSLSHRFLLLPCRPPQVLNVKGQLNAYKMQKMMEAQRMLGRDSVYPLSGGKGGHGGEEEGGDEDEGEVTPTGQSLRTTTDQLKRSLDTAVAKLQSRSGAPRSAGERAEGDARVTMSDVREMYGKAATIRRSLEAELEQSTQIASDYFFSTPTKATPGSRRGARGSHRASPIAEREATPRVVVVTPPRSAGRSRDETPWRPPGITPSPGWKDGPQDY